MNSRSLFQLIQSLTPAQKANFSSYLASGKRKVGKYKILYDRILSLKQFDDRQIRGKEFSNPTTYYQNREILLDKIVQSLVFYQDAKISFRGYVIQALELDAVDLARKRFLTELTQAVEGNDLDYIHYLLSFRRRVERAHQLQIVRDHEIEEASKLGLEKTVLDKLQAIFAKVKSWTKRGIDEVGQLAIVSTYAELETLQPMLPESRYWDAKIKSGLALLQLDIPTAFSFLNKAAGILEKHAFPFSNSLLIRENYLMIQLAHQVNDLEMARDLTMQFALLEPKNAREAVLKKEFWAKSAIRTGFATANISLVKSALPDLLAMDKLTLQSQVLNLFYAAKVAFLNDEFSMARRWLQSFRRLKSSASLELNWAAEQLRLLILVEEGDLDAAESSYRTSLRLAKQLEGDNLQLSTKLSYRSLEANCRADHRMIFKQYQMGFKLIEGAKKEIVALDLMNISFWLESRATGSAMMSIYKRGTASKPTVQLRKSV